MIKHTPAPWIAFHAPDQEGQVIVSASPNENKWPVAICDCGIDLSGDEALANAQLISCAPEMLTLLELIKTYYDQLSVDVPVYEIRMRLTQMIGKAKGETNVKMY